MLTKLCIFVTAFGAVNWALLSMYGTDALRHFMGADRTIVSDGLKIVVVLAALQILYASLATKKSK